MSISLKIDSRSRKVLVGLKNIEQYSRKSIRMSYYDLGKDLIKESRRLILEPPKTGRVYKIKRNKRVRRHQASAPGEAPANLSGNLRKSLNFIVHGDGKMEFGSEDRTGGGKSKDVGYGGFLELGTSKIRARPYLLPSIKSNYRNAITYFKSNYMRFAKKSGSVL